MAIQLVDGNADAIGNVLGTYAITTGANDQLAITIDGGSVQTVTLNPGVARSAAQVAADINAVLTLATAYVSRGFVRIRTASALGASSSVVIGSPSNNANSTLGLTAGTYTGWGRVNTTMTINAKQDIINNLEAILLTVGWTTVSGHNTTNLLMQSRFTPPGQDLVVRARFKDNGGTCVQVTLENYSGSLAGTSSVTAGGNLLPGTAKTYRVIANGYGFFVFTAGASAAREYVHLGTVALPSFLYGNITDAGFMECNSQSDAGSTICNSFRTLLGLCFNTTPNSNYLLNGNFWELANTNSNQLGMLVLTSQQAPIYGSGSGGYQWHDGSPNELDALLVFGSPTVNSVGMIRGYLWDCFVVTDAYTADATAVTSDGHNVYAITVNNTGNTNISQLRGTLFVVVS